MSFFYNLNKKLDGIRATPEATHQQLNERDMSRAAKGYEKYGKEGMEALAKAGREGKALDPVRAKYDKYNNTEVDEGAHSQDAMKLNPDFDKLGRKPGIMGKIGSGLKKVADVIAPGDDELLDRLEKSSGAAPRQPGAKEPRYMEAMSPAKQKSFAALAPPTDKITFADKIAGAKKEVDEMLGDVAAEAMKSALGGGRGRNSKMDETQGATTYTVAYKDPKKPGKSYSTQVKATSAAEAKAAFQDWDESGRFTYLGSRPDVDKVHEASADNAFTAHKRPRAETPKVGTITHGSKHDVEEIPGGRRVTRRTDAQGISVGADDDKPADGEKRSRGRPKGLAKAPERVTSGATKHKGGRKTNEGSDYGQAQQIYDDLADVRAVAKQAQRGGEFPQGFASRLESVLYAAMTLIKNQQAGGAQVSEQDLDEKATSKKQQKFMGMVHAAQKGEKPASGAVAKVAKDMGKKDVKDFAATKHKGLPEKKKPKDKDKKKEVEETSDNTPGKSSGGFKFGGGIYDSINRDLENMIAESMSRLDESMSINMSMNNDEHGGPTRSLTVTATDDDAAKLAQLLKSAGLGGGDDSYGSEQHMHEVSMNQPDYPTNTETSDDALQYSGGLNKPKSTGQTTIPVIASQDERQESYAAEEEDAIKRMMEMAGVKKKAVEEEKTDEGNLFTKGLADDNVKVGDKIPGTNAVKKKDIDESIFAMTANLWKTYKG